MTCMRVCLCIFQPLRVPSTNSQSMGGYLEVCQGCDGLGQQEEILTCCQCAASYHTYCLDPPWEGMPTPQWRCGVCISEEYNKPSEVFGFEQANKEYTLREYSRMANKFKEDYFSEPVIVSGFEMCAMLHSMCMCSVPKLVCT